METTLGVYLVAFICIDFASYLVHLLESQNQYFLEPTPHPPQQ